MRFRFGPTISAICHSRASLTTQDKLTKRELHTLANKYEVYCQHVKLLNNKVVRMRMDDMPEAKSRNLRRHNNFKYNCVWKIKKKFNASNVATGRFKIKCASLFFTALFREVQVIRRANIVQCRPSVFPKAYDRDHHETKNERTSAKVTTPTPAPQFLHEAVNTEYPV
jgi:hypothetical protein